MWSDGYGGFYSRAGKGDSRLARQQQQQPYWPKLVFSASMRAKRFATQVLALKTSFGQYGCAAAAAWPAWLQRCCRLCLRAYK